MLNPVEVDDWLSYSNGYVTQAFVGGDECDVASGKQNRTVEARLSCGESIKPKLVDVQEPESCKYIFDVRVASLCQHPKLASNKKQNKVIQCRAV